MARENRDGTIQATRVIEGDDAKTNAIRQWLVQIHPFDLDKGKIEIGDGTLVVGREESCGLRIEDASISRRHASFANLEDGVRIEDLGSTNGVFVNETQVASATLKSGDRVRFGQHIFRFLSDNDTESEYYETVYSMMTRDALTSAYNKRYLEECLDREVIRSCRHRRPLALILIDVDHFKSINDKYGHSVGDEVLRELALRLTGALRQSDVFARFGGEEFAIVAVESNLASALVVAERCRQVIAERPFETSAGEISITISLGVAAPDPNSDFDQKTLVTDADARLYEAKDQGRNQVVS